MKNSFIIYHSYMDIFEDLTDEQLGKLFRAFFNYELHRIEPDFVGEMKIAFKFIKKDLDVNLEKYEKTCEKNRLNGLKGGAPIGNQNAKKQPKTTQNNPDNPSGYLNNPKQPKQADEDEEDDEDEVDENDIYKVSKKESNINNLNACACESYDEIFENLGVSPELKKSYISFIKHCQVNGHTIINDKLKDIIIRLDMTYGGDDVPKHQSLQRAINGGYFDIQECRV